ncbi:unnamed protein product [Cylindrotheca closterium]|uniref:ERCC4 domain-containing protein n=1 Tax=Cylindrotheca closterium TaxID=2856 RepID=A0AAD2JN72_9STRA|nr:unnamed protein product [Cylindrotheca closterium]
MAGTKNKPKKPKKQKKALIPDGLLPAYLASAFGDLYEEDGLMVMARGLGWLNLLAAFCRFYGDVQDGYLSLLKEENPNEKRTKPPLVMVLGMKDTECAALTSLLETWGTPHELQPTILTNENGGSDDRRELYSRGGVFCITSRILIVDLLTKTVSPDEIEGMMVTHADQVTNDSTSAFIIRIFTSLKQREKCFIKAITGRPEGLAMGFNKVDKTLKALQVRNLFLYPRFHEHVKQELEVGQPDLEELHQPLSPLMSEIQLALVSAVQACLRELKRSTPFVEWQNSELSIENCVTTSFDRMITKQLEKDWHRLKPETKQLSQDLRTLRTLFQSLIQYDCIKFYSFINSIKTMSASSRRPSMWLLTPAAEVMFKKAKERMYTIKKGKPTAKVPNPVSRLRRVLEENPKWMLLKNVLLEIKEEESKHSQGKRFAPTILVMCKDAQTTQILKTYLYEGKDQLMLDRWHRWLITNNDRSKNFVNGKIPEETRLLAEEEGSVGLKLKHSNQDRRANAKKRQLNTVPDFLRKRRRIALEKGRNGAFSSTEDREREAVLEEALEEVEHQYESKPAAASKRDLVAEGNQLEEEMYQTSFIEEPRIVIKSLSSVEADEGASLLQDVMPDYVILYDSDVAFIRSLEVYSAMNPIEDRKLKIYFLIFSASAEDKVFRKNLEREQKAFVDLIEHKQKMPPPVLNTEATQECREAILHGSIGGTYAGGSLPLAFDTRRAKGINKNDIRRDIAVDVREFRAALPSILHQGGMRLAPVTLTVGDFVLSSVHCIERKSISDLFGSLASGRLYTQAEAMSKYYKVPALLIEFDPSKSFCLQNSNDMGLDIKMDSICSKLVILTLHFPKLRILWSKSPHETLELFKTLKQNHDEVDVDKAVEIGRSDSIEALLTTEGDGEEEEEDQINEAARDMLLRLPGVNVNNARKIMRECESLAELSRMSRQELRNIAGPLAGQKLFSFFRQNLKST